MALWRPYGHMVVEMLGHMAIWLSNNHMATLKPYGYLTTIWLPYGCMAIKMLGNMTIWKIYDHMAIGMLGHMAIWLTYSCMDTVQPYGDGDARINDHLATLWPFGK